MKIAVFTGLRNVAVVEAPEPEIRQPGEVLLRIDRVGICGSDVHYYTQGRIGSQVLQYPATLGHECSGTVLGVGSGVTGLAPGDRVAVDPALVCGSCDQCRLGRPNTCRALRFMGCPGEAAGAAAQQCVLPADNCLPIPASMSLDQAALVEPLSVALYAVRLAGIASHAQEPVPAGASSLFTPRESEPPASPKVAVLGVGPIGLGVLLCLKAAGPCVAYATDLLPERLAAARHCGADAAFDARQDVVAELARREPQGLDCVFECSGDPACLDQGQRLLAPGGKLLMIGIPPDEQVLFDPHRARRAELTLQAVRRQRDCVVPTIRMIAQARLDPAPLVTHRFRLDEIRAALELAAAYRDGVIKAMLDLTGAW